MMWTDGRAIRRIPLVQVIDLDAAMGRDGNDALVHRLCRALPCQAGGGVRTVARARALLDAGAHRVIAGSSLYSNGGVNIEAAQAFADAIPIIVSWPPSTAAAVVW